MEPSYDRKNQKCTYFQKGALFKVHFFAIVPYCTVTVTKNHIRIIHACNSPINVDVAIDACKDNESQRLGEK